MGPAEGTAPRQYDATRRRERGEADRAQTRARVLQAAGQLLAERGYAGTTIAELARRAGVSVQTIYLAIGGKAQVLRELMATQVVADDPDTALVNQAWVGEVAAEPDPHQQLRRLAHESVALFGRLIPLWRLMTSAAQDEPGLAEDLTRQTAGRLQDQQAFIRLIHGPLRDDLTPEHAGDILYTLASPQVWELLTTDRNWTPDQFEDFLADALTLLLLPPVTPGERQG